VLVAQASLTALPDELLASILRRAWADRPPRPAAKEMRAAAGLASLCRRVRELLCAPPLPLALDFSAARLSIAQLCWLREPAQAGRVEAASFHHKDLVWEPLSLKSFLALHGRTLLHLSGVPLQLLACVSQGQRPGLDLSGLRLTKLGIHCIEIERLLRVEPPGHVWFWPERLPGSLEELHLLSLYDDWLGSLAWAPRPCQDSGSGLAGRLPRLHTLRVTRLRRTPAFSIDRVSLLDGFPVLPAFEVDGSGMDIHVHDNLFGRVRFARIVASGFVSLLHRHGDEATFVDRLCPAGLQAAELCAGTRCKLSEDRTFGEEVVWELISRCGERYAVEVGVYASPGEGYRALIYRLAWRRWPARGAPDLQAARAAHERARAWTAAGRQQ